jgi:hypothetical protein
VNVISRNIISKNFTYVEADKKYYIEDLYNNIDYWKYVLKKVCNVSAGETIGFGLTNLNLDYFGLVFASLELSLQIVILDYSSGAHKNNFKDFKNEIYGKIDTFIYFNKRSKKTKSTLLFDQKIKYYVSKSKNYFNIRDLKNIQIKENIYKNIMPNSDDIMLFCTSSGSTGTPKIVKHNHNFMYNLVMRNKKFFKGSVLHLKNLHHGSSLAVFFLPTLASDLVSFHTSHSLDSKKIEDVVKIIYNLKIENVMFPYTHDIENFLLNSENCVYNNLNIYTLSYISPNWQKYLTIGIQKFESIFGSNETSGPLFLSTLEKQYVKFDPTEFNIIDDFYKFDFSSVLEVTMPVYNTKIKTNDIFIKENKKIYHKGRKDIIKINQVILDLHDLTSISSKINNNGEIITDTVYNKIYVALWSNLEYDKNIKIIKTELKKINHRLKIDNVKILKIDDFYRGIKLDKELIRDYFRNL